MRRAGSIVQDLPPDPFITVQGSVAGSDITVGWNTSRPNNNTIVLEHWDTDHWDVIGTYDNDNDPGGLASHEFTGTYVEGDTYRASLQCDGYPLHYSEQFPD